MLVIRPAQFEALEVGIRDAFDTSLAFDLRAEHPDNLQRLDDSLLMRLTTLAVDKAEHFGLEEAADVRRLASLYILVGWHFDTCPRFAPWLTDLAEPPDARLDRLLNTAQPADWADAALHSAACLDAMRAGMDRVR